MATYTFVRATNQITINDFVDVYPDNYELEADALNQVVIVKEANGKYQAEIDVAADTVTINAVAFSGTAAELKDALYESIFTASSGGGGTSYLVYTALLRQSGTDAPLATVLENTLGGTIVWTRAGVGEYTGTLAGVFTENKTVFFCNTSGTEGYQLTSAGYNDANSFTVFNYDSTFALIDSMVAYIKIVIYP